MNAREHTDVAAGGAFFSLNVTEATALIEKMVLNQGWSDEWIQPHKRCMQTMKEVDMFFAKMDLLMKRLEDHANWKKDRAAIEQYATTQALEADITCEVCENMGHSWK